MMRTWRRLRAAILVNRAIARLRVKNYGPAQRLLLHAVEILDEQPPWVVILRAFVDHQLGDYASAINGGAAALQGLDEGKGRWSPSERVYLTMYCIGLCRSAVNRGAPANARLLDRLRAAEPEDPPVVGAWLRDLFPLSGRS